jgi:hypothetical protein
VYGIEPLPLFLKQGSAPQSTFLFFLFFRLCGAPEREVRERERERKEREQGGECVFVGGEWGRVEGERKE